MDFRDNPQSDVLEAVTGYNFTPQLMKIGARIYTLERLILNREGISRKDDLLPERVTKEAVPSGPSKGRILTEEMYTVMLDEYYEARGWDEDGVPTPETIRKLVKLQIKYLAALRDRTGRRQEEVSFPQGTTLQDVAEWLNGQYDLSLPNPQVMATLNGSGWNQFPLKLATEIREGDIICLFPPIAGG
jgi:molybdopterin converting factor small subunit